MATETGLSSRFERPLKTLVAAALVSVAACGGYRGGGNSGNASRSTDDTPAAAYGRLYAAVKSKDTRAIRDQMSRRTNEWGDATAGQFGKTPAEHFANGFTATTFAETLPPVRDPRIKDQMAAIEVWNGRDGTWEDLPFILEDGRWRFAVGDHFMGHYRPPGPGQSVRERRSTNGNAANSSVGPLPK